MTLSTEKAASWLNCICIFCFRCSFEHWWHQITFKYHTNSHQALFYDRAQHSITWSELFFIFYLSRILLSQPEMRAFLFSSRLFFLAKKPTEFGRLYGYWYARETTLNPLMTMQFSHGCFCQPANKCPNHDNERDFLAYTPKIERKMMTLLVANNVNVLKPTKDACESMRQLQ